MTTDQSSGPRASGEIADELLTVLDGADKQDVLERHKQALLGAWLAGEIGQQEYDQRVSDLEQIYAITERPKVRAALDRINNDSPTKRLARRVLNIVRRS